MKKIMYGLNQVVSSITSIHLFAHTNENTFLLDAQQAHLKKHPTHLEASVMSALVAIKCIQ